MEDSTKHRSPSGIESAYLSASTFLAAGAILLGGYAASKTLEASMDGPDQAQVVYEASLTSTESIVCGVGAAVMLRMGQRRRKPAAQGEE